MAQKRKCMKATVVRMLVGCGCALLMASCAELRQMQQKRPAPAPLLRHGGTNRPLIIKTDAGAAPYPAPPPGPAYQIAWQASAAPPPQTAPAKTAAVGEWRQASAPKSQELAGGARLHQLAVSNGQGRADLQVVVFDSRLCTFRVIDQPVPGAGGAVIAQLMRSRQAIAGVNGGFFHPDFEPLGVMVAGGRKKGRFTTNRLIAGSVLTVGKEPYLVWNSEFLGEKGVTDLIQSGPRLVDLRRPIEGLKRTQIAARTFVATDGKRTWAIGAARSATLADLGEMLATPGLIPGMQVQRALNLDGGNSTAFWARTTDGREITQPGWSTVRNYLAVVAR